MSDYLIVGAGLYGATCARFLSDAGKSVRVIDKNDYYGGNCKTTIVNQIIRHDFGPHVFHTNNEAVWSFVNKYATFVPFTLRVKAINDGIYSFPINLLTLYQVFGVKTIEEARIAITNDLIHFDKPSNFEERALATVGKTLYNLFYRGYTTKQWQTNPQNLSADLFNRLPVRFTFDDNYFLKHRSKYCGVPFFGYSDLIRNMLIGIPCDLGTSFEIKDIENYKKVIFTGSPDTLLNYAYGRLPYRSLRFDHQTLPINDFQGAAVINFTNENVPYTRITEHKHFNPQQTDHTIITYEYPANIETTNNPLYPINNTANNALYSKYVDEIDKKYPNVILGGRLGLYQYLDMDQAIEKAMIMCTELF